MEKQKQKKVKNAFNLFAVAFLLCSAELPIMKGRLMLVVPKDHDERYLLGALIYLSAAANKRTICDRRYSGFAMKTGQGEHRNVKPGSLPMVRGKPLVEDAPDGALTLLTEAEELLLDRQCSLGVENLVAITTYDLLNCEQQYLLHLGFRIVHTGFGELNQRAKSPQHFEKIRDMIKVVRSENFCKEKSRLQARVIKMAKKHPTLDALIEISHRDRLMTVTCDPSHCDETGYILSYFERDLIASPAEAVKLCDAVVKQTTMYKAHPELACKVHLVYNMRDAFQQRFFCRGYTPTKCLKKYLLERGLMTIMQAVSQLEELHRRGYFQGGVCNDSILLRVRADLRSRDLE